MPKRSRTARLAITNLPWCQEKRLRVSLDGEKENNPPVEPNLDHHLELAANGHSGVIPASEAHSPAVVSVPDKPVEVNINVLSTRHHNIILEQDNQHQNELVISSNKSDVELLLDHVSEHSDRSWESSSDDGSETSDSSEMSSGDRQDGSPEFYGMEMMEGYEELDSAWRSFGHSLAGTDDSEPNIGRTEVDKTPAALDPHTAESLSQGVPTVSEPSQAFPWYSIDFRMPPTINAAKLALADLSKLLRPPRNGNRGYKPSGLSHSLEQRLSWMEYFLRDFANSGTPWSAAALKTAKLVGRGTYIARRLREWSKAFVLDREKLPSTKCSASAKSTIEDEDLREELRTHLRSLGKYVTAKAIIHYLAKPDVQQRYNLSKTVSLATAQRWMERAGYTWTTARNGQYVDGHEREDVVEYRQNKFLPAWYALEPKMRKWSTIEPTQLEEGQSLPIRPTVIWFHDESTFYAHDRRKKRWVHRDETSTPQPKGEGLSLMVVDFVSADYGWLRSPDGKESARVLFRAGKGRDGYFSNDDIIRQTETAMTILEKYFPDEDHVFIFDNASTHLKRAEDAPCARNMPRGCTDWGISVPKRGSAGKPVHAADGKPVMQKIRVTDGHHNGTPQAFYWPEGHENASLFKGMGQILTERGYDVKGLKAQCKNFKCPPNTTNCCCRRLLYSQPDFTNVESRLETICRERGFQVLFLPKFHCELNFIEQCWGYGKRLYRCYPLSSKDSDLEQNVIRALDSVPLTSMRRFAIRSRRFMDAYHKGLNGKQAAWASRKYRGHRVLPASIMDELENAQIL